MTTRRGLVGLFLAAGLAGAATRAGATAASRPGLADLAQLPPERSPAWIDGQGWFEAVPAAGEAPDGVLRLAGPEGWHWQRRDAPGVLRPEWFVDPADGGDAAVAIQRACDHAARQGPFVIDLGAARHACRTRIVLDPTRVALRGVGAVLDFTAMPAPAPAEPVAQLGDLWTTDGWRHDAGALLREEGPRTALTHALMLPRPGRYRITLELAEIAGAGPHPFLTVALSAAAERPLGRMTVTAPGLHVFEVETASDEPAATLTLESDARLRLIALSVEWQGWRECLLVRSTAESPQYGHKFIEGVEILGPGDGTGLHGLRFETRAPTRSSRLDLRGVVVKGFHTGILFSHRAYLIRAYGLRCLSEIGLHFLGGTEDAGELCAFFGSIIGGARIAILMHGGEVALDGTSVDFVDQILVGTGTVTMTGCHLEINRPRAADRPPVDLSAGSLTMNGGVFLVTGRNFDKGNQCDVIFRLRSAEARATMRDVTVYNLRTRSDALADGPGRLDTERLSGHPPRHIAPIVQFDEARNLLGPFPRDIRTSGSPTGVLQRHPLKHELVRILPEHRCIWLCGRPRPGAEVGVALEIRGDRPGRVVLRLQALHDQERTDLADPWSIEVADSWTPVRVSTANARRGTPGGGRMPDGWANVAVMLDLTGYAGRAEVRGVFLCAT